MYFRNRAEAGRQLAMRLRKYKDELCTVVALNSGGVLVGAQIAMRLHASLMVLTSDEIILPGETEPVASMTTNTLTYNNKYTQGEIDEFVSEYHGLIEDQRVQKYHKLNRLLSDGGQINPDLLRHHIIILVSDAFQTGISLSVASDYLKSIKYKKLVVVAPIASVNAIDKMHLVGDEIFCLGVTENLMESNHYFEDNNLPPHKEAVKIIRDISLNWDFSTAGNR